MHQINRRQCHSLEQIIKGAANHRRIEILFLLAYQKGLSTESIVDRLDLNYQTGAHHIRRLVGSGLVLEYRDGNMMLHDLSRVGQSIIKLLRILK